MDAATAREARFYGEQLIGLPVTHCRLLLALSPCLACVLLLWSPSAAPAERWLIDRVAGTGSADDNGDSGPAASTNIGDPFGVELGPDGALYVTEIRHHRIRRLDLKIGQLATVAGCGSRGYSGDGGPALPAQLNEPYEVRFDAAGNMIFVEMRNHIVRRVDAKTGVIETIAGTGQPGYSGDGGPATKAQLNQPHSIALDRDGAIYIADIGNHRIRRVDPSTGIIESIAGAEEKRLPIDGQPARNRPILGPRALHIYDNVLWIALREGHSVWRMNLADGILHHIAGTGTPGHTGDGGPAATATLNGPKGIVADDNAVYVVDSANNAIRRIDLPAKQITTIHADANAEVSATLNQPHGICISRDGQLFVGDTLNQRVVRYIRIE